MLLMLVARPTLYFQLTTRVLPRNHSNNRNAERFENFAHLPDLDGLAQ
jgi:hypothetical protein